MFISKAGASVIDYILCTYDIGRCLRTFQVRDMLINDHHNITETLIEVEDTNEDKIADKMNEYDTPTAKDV
jgi:hypothetical protein